MILFITLQKSIVNSFHSDFTGTMHVLKATIFNAVENFTAPVVARDCAAAKALMPVVSS